MKKKVIAIFEDDPVSRFIYERLFSTKENVELHIFDNSEKGIAHAKKTPFDVVFIEIHFWETFGGISILNKLRETFTSSTNSTTFIAMTSLLQEGDLDRIMSAGFIMCMEKPVVFSEMDLSSI